MEQTTQREELETKVRQDKHISLNSERALEEAHDDTLRAMLSAATSFNTQHVLLYDDFADHFRVTSKSSQQDEGLFIYMFNYGFIPTYLGMRRDGNAENEFRRPQGFEIEKLHNGMGRIEETDR